MPSVVICDDHRVFGQSLSAVLRAHGYDVKACTSDPEAGAAAVAEHRPHLYLLDLHFPGCSSLGGLSAVVARSPGTRTVVLSGSCDPQAAAKARTAGASGFVAKDHPLEEILSALAEIASGSAVFHAPAGDPRSQPAEKDRPSTSIARCLTSREREVLDGLVQGQDTATLARSMGITYSTVRTHIQNVLSKLGVHSKLEAVALVMDEAG